MNPKSNRYTTRGSLVSAVENGKISAVNTLLSRGLSVDNTDALNNTLLHIATANNDEKMVNLLLKYKAKIDQLDYQERTPIHLAASLGHLKIFKLLINSSGYEGRRRNINIRTPVNAAPIHYAAMQGHLHLIKYIIKNGGKVEVQQSDNGALPLLYAVARGHSDSVEELFNHVTLTNTNYVKKYEYLVHFLIFGNFVYGDYKRYSKPSKVKELEYMKILKQIFNSRVRLVKDARNLVRVALINKRFLIARMFIRYYLQVDVDYMSRHCVLERASAYAPVKFIDFLLKTGAVLYNDSNKVTSLAIHQMSHTKNYKILSLLIRAGADINAKTNGGDTIIECVRNYTPKDDLFLYIILMYGVDINAPIKNGDSTGLFTLCVKCFHYSSCLGVLLDWFLDFNVMNRSGYTPLLYAILFGKSKKCIESIIKVMTVKVRIDQRFEINLLDMFAIQFFYLEFYDDCVAELENLKLNKFWNEISFFDLLDKPLEKLMVFSRNLDLMRVVEWVLNTPLRNLTFPVYGDLIKSRMCFAIRLRNFHDKSLKTLDKLVWPIQLPDIVSCKILSYLIVDEWEKLSLM